MTVKGDINLLETVQEIDRDMFSDTLFALSECGKLLRPFSA